MYRQLQQFMPSVFELVDKYFVCYSHVNFGIFCILQKSRNRSFTKTLNFNFLPVLR